MFTTNGRSLPAPHRDALLSTVDPIPALADKLITGGRLNVARALAKLLGQPAPPPPPDPPCAPGWALPAELCVPPCVLRAAQAMALPCEA